MLSTKKLLCKEPTGKNRTTAIISEGFLGLISHFRIISEDKTTDAMKNAFALFGFGLFLSLPSLAFACKCIPPTIERALYGDVENVFVGRIKRRLVSPSPNRKYYLAQVMRIFKGCSFPEASHIIVSTGESSASCGLLLEPKTYHILSGNLEKMDDSLVAQLGNLTITGEVSAGSCEYNMPWESTPLAEKKLLRKYKKNDNLSCSPVTLCNTGTDCPASYFCDNSERCVSFTIPCPVDSPAIPCLVNPCTVADPCQDAPGGVTCLPYYCGSCNVVWIDSNRNIVCDT
jgi:hypothetical protein